MIVLSGAALVLPDRILSPGTLPATPEAINANRSPLQSKVGQPATLLLTTEGVPDSQLPGGNPGLFSIR